MRAADRAQPRRIDVRHLRFVDAAREVGPHDLQRSRDERRARRIDLGETLREDGVGLGVELGGFDARSFRSVGTAGRQRAGRRDPVEQLQQYVAPGGIAHARERGDQGIECCWALSKSSALGGAAEVRRAFGAAHRRARPSGADSRQWDSRHRRVGADARRAREKRRALRHADARNRGWIERLNLLGFENALDHGVPRRRKARDDDCIAGHQTDRARTAEVSPNTAQTLAVLLRSTRFARAEKWLKDSSFGRLSSAGKRLEIKKATAFDEDSGPDRQSRRSMQITTSR